MSIKLDLELNEVNGVLQALATLPYGQVADLITKIRSQAEPQAKQEEVLTPEVVSNGD